MLETTCPYIRNSFTPKRAAPCLSIAVECTGMVLAWPCLGWGACVGGRMQMAYISRAGVKHLMMRIRPLGA